MVKKFAELRARMSPDSRARSEDKARRLMTEMALNELRRARGMSQEDLALVLHVKQPSIAKFEQRADTYISTLRDHIRGLGGELEIIAVFPEGDVKITNFEVVENEA
jgi:transcriptional regulator with XRE-family HTH domain